MSAQEATDLLQEVADLISFLQSCSGKTDYVSHEYHLLTTKYGFHADQTWLKKKIRDIFSETLFHLGGLDVAYKRLKRIGFLDIDLDGLKSVNDIGSHSLGDDLLDQICFYLSVHPSVRIHSPAPLDLSFCNPKISAFCEFFDARLSVVRTGGDEFAIYVERLSGYLDDEVSYEILDGETVNRKFIYLLRDIISYEVSLSRFLKMDFHSPEIQEHLGEYGCALLKKAEQHTGKKFFFAPSISIGECTTLLEVLLQFIKSFPKEWECLPKERLCDILMGMAVDTANGKTTKRKVALKKRLWDSPLPERNMQALMITRSEADKATAILIHKLRHLNARRRSFSEELHSLQSLKECALGEIAKKNSQRSKKFLADIENCVSLVRDSIFSLDASIQKLLG